MERVTSVDNTGNSRTKDVIGNKEDAAVATVGTTGGIIGYLKGILAYLLVPTADASTNTAAKDVIGNKTDAAVGVATTTKSLMAYIKGLLGFITPTAVTGTTDIDDSVQTESTAFPILTVAPAAGAPLRNVYAIFDLAKATTGFAAVETSVTIQLRVARKIDGTNWRGEAYVEAALSGTNAAGRAMKVPIGTVGEDEEARVEAVFSTDVTADMEIPYVLYYEGTSAPTVTEVAAG